LFRGEEDSTVGGLVDIAPTILDLMQLPLPGGWQGRSLMRPVDRQRVYFTAPWSGALFGYREGDRKYLFDAITDTYRAFDLGRDPSEATNLAGDLSSEDRDRIYQQTAAWVQYQERLVESVMRREQK
jgi:arylsulfatase A-like enzyme